MAKRQILVCVLTAVVLVIAGCGFFESESGTSQPTSSPTTKQSKPPIEFAGAHENVKSALDKLATRSRSNERPVTVREVKSDLNLAIGKLGESERAVGDACDSCSPELKRHATDAWKALRDAKENLGKDSDVVTDLEPPAKIDLENNLNRAASLLTSAAKIASSGETPSPTPGNVTSGQESKEDPSGQSSWSLDGILIRAVQIFGALLILTLLAFGLMFLWKRMWKSVETNVGQIVTTHLSTVRDIQPDHSQKLSSISSAQKDISNSLVDLLSEVRALARLVRESTSGRQDRRQSPMAMDYQTPVQEFTAKEEPEFPVSAVDYLGKMDRYALVVRPDFQNGILVNDPEGKGELVLIRDSRLPDETQPLFVIPRATQFLNKQDFHTYYQKYYDCVRPSAGDVWIIDPAVVEKVTGGWQLREKGVLEIR
jgi:hypothetical protein